MKFLLFLIFLANAAVAQQQEYLVESNNALKLMEEKKYEEAISIFSFLVDKYPRYSTYRYHRALSYSYLLKYNEALADYKILAQQLSDEPEYYFQAGALFEKIEKPDSAEWYYSKAISLTQEDYQYYSQRGTFYLKQGLYSKAVSDLDASIRLNPNHLSSLHNRGNALSKLGNKKKLAKTGVWHQALVVRCQKNKLKRTVNNTPAQNEIN